MPPSTPRRSEPRAGERPGRELGLRPVSTLPPRAKGVLALAGVALVAFLVWLPLRAIATEHLALAVLLIVGGYVAAAVVAVAVVTVVRLLFSLGALPYLLGRGVRRLLVRR